MKAWFWWSNSNCLWLRKTCWVFNWSYMIRKYRASLTISVFYYCIEKIVYCGVVRTCGSILGELYELHAKWFSDWFLLLYFSILKMVCQNLGCYCNILHVKSFTLFEIINITGILLQTACITHVVMESSGELLRAENKSESAISWGHLLFAPSTRNPAKTWEIFFQKSKF